MASSEQSQSQLPTSAIENQSTQKSDAWFEYIVRVHPHHTDYAGVVWHGTYISWMEEARIESLRSIGIEYAELVNLGCDLPVVELSVRYHKAVKFGMVVAVRTRMTNTQGVKLDWDYQIQSLDGKELYVTARVTLVTVDREKGKIMRRLPPKVEAALTKLY
ncbi:MULTISPECIES: thioesterase family protein [Okeania]|uniref:Acyl-CoA thioesterase n=1 Tax=Okeania hirsuta TaxID=1458930 RepID=A0A3N6R8E1_9CYAN|nr:MULTISPECIES: thioesterase family protein [Okeania]NEP03474.1 acyl-CoA thioesterase [Okeania sp. SIO4D6]NEP39565.1 acyl-CoA thioesterase [Okeania sp. SIO2H7]NEP71398.1 acyl-CoA thioesterase [Okeania sp. SIO2G5]NEP87237.1 acyl-CoA thioesterase [Okeania sp. SIO2C2]NEP92710.1 acyl-CoA thioesterase [Okeania sp. SIO2F5]